MNSDLLVPAALGALLVLAMVGLVLVVRDRRRSYAALEAALEAARADAQLALAEVAALRVRLDSAAARSEPTEYVITHLGEDGDRRLEASRYSTTNGPARPPQPTGAEAGRIDGRLFADLVMRETVVKAAAFGFGVRRAMAPEVRNRIRFEMRREMKRSRRERRDEYKQVRREMRDRQRSAVSTP